MTSKKTAFIIPGHTESEHLSQYKKIAASFGKRGYKPVRIHIDWRYRTMSDYIDQFLVAARRHPGDCVILGFSFGAIIAVATAAELKPERLFLCSLSPYFREDLARLPAAWKHMMGKRRMADFASRSFADVARGVRCPVSLFAGETELRQFPSLDRRVRDAHERLQRSTLTVVPDGKHNLAQPQYLAAVQNAIRK